MATSTGDFCRRQDVLARHEQTQHGVLARRTATDRPATSQARDWVVRQVDVRWRRGSGSCSGSPRLEDARWRASAQNLRGRPRCHLPVATPTTVLPRPKISLPSPVTASFSAFQIQPPMFFAPLIAPWMAFSILSQTAGRADLREQSADGVDGGVAESIPEPAPDGTDAADLQLHPVDELVGDPGTELADGTPDGRRAAVAQKIQDPAAKTKRSARRPFFRPADLAEAIVAGLKNGLRALRFAFGELDPESCGRRHQGHQAVPIGKLGAWIANELIDWLEKLEIREHVRAIGRWLLECILRRRHPRHRADCLAKIGGWVWDKIEKAIHGAINGAKRTSAAGSGTRWRMRSPDSGAR